MREQTDTDPAAATRDEREALLMRLGGLAFAVYADECECVTRWAEPAPLPHAPAPVLGVVSVRGRMRTVLDPARLFETAGRGPERRPAECALVVSLAGDEQLALACETADRVSFAPHELAPPPEPHALPARATLTRDGETVHLLDPARLFDAAMIGTERRRHRAVSREP
ncbi:MAG TPA: chemotaxis protein CheW [Pyrinomonadaceae bacterium]|jgi:chemotaxis signal transduction protein